MENSVLRPKVLIVDDSPNDIRLMGRILSQNCQVLFATNGRDAMEFAVANMPDLILLDIMMPEIDGLTICAWLGNDKQTCGIPVIIVTEYNNPEVETRGFAAGAVDFITKPVSPPVVRARVAVHLALRKQRNDLEKANSLLQAEIHERKRLEKELREQADFDPLTGLPNRKLFNDRLQQSVLMGERNQGNFALLFIDLDRFKWVNDTMGHDAGDSLLIEVAQRLKSLVRKSDTVARLGGDEFTIIISDVIHESLAEVVARKVLEQLGMVFNLMGREVSISGSVGIAIFPSDGTTAQELVTNADRAMYQAKESGKNTFQFFSQEVNRLLHRRMNLEAEMRLALQKHEFFLDYQPKINLVTGQMMGMEALVRWDHPREGILFPDKFIVLAEGTGLITEIGAWVLRTACHDSVSWADFGFPNLKLAVNLSALQFRDGEELLDLVKNTLLETGFQAHNLELEITESMMMIDTEKVSNTLRKLREMGVAISMDDFGTGYSSLALLKNLPIQVIKIDRSFISGMTKNSKNASFVFAIISMAKQLGLHVVVEGVETSEQLQMLQGQGGDDVQGYFFSPPLGKDGFLALLRGEIPLGGGGGKYMVPS